MKSRLFLLMAYASIAICAISTGGARRAFAAGARVPYDDRAVVVLSSETDLPQLAMAMGAQARIEESEGQIAVLKFAHVVGPSDLHEIRILPFVRSAEVDHSVKIRGLQVSDCPDAGDAQPQITIPDLSALKCPANPLKSCQLGETCPGGRLKFWSYDRLGVEPMLNELAKLGVPQGSVRIADVDTGFDVKGNRAQMASASFSVKPGHPSAGDPAHDPNGHGTSTASLIGGGNGIGIAPFASLTVYRATQSKEDGMTSEASLLLSLQRACRDGNEIINMSWSGGNDESGKSSDEVTQHRIIEDLASHGCLIIKASGNDGFQDRDPRQERLDDAYLRIAATSRFGNAASFSTRGEVSAPGEQIFVLHSKEAKPVAEKPCQTAEGEQEDGTSLAAPITSAVAGAVLGVLKIGTHYRNLSPPARIQIVNRILKASGDNWGINALRAVMIAERWNSLSEKESEKGALSQISVDDLRKTLVSSPDPSCQKPVPTCQGIDTCDALRSWLRETQVRLSLCPMSAQERAIALRELLFAAIRGDDLDHATIALRDIGHTEFPHPQVPIGEVESFFASKVSDPKLPLSDRIALAEAYREASMRDLPQAASMLRAQVVEALRDPKASAEDHKATDTLIRSSLMGPDFTLDFVRSPATRAHALEHLLISLAETRTIPEHLEEIVREITKRPNLVSDMTLSLAGMLLAHSPSKPEHGELYTALLNHPLANAVVRTNLAMAVAIHPGPAPWAGRVLTQIIKSGAPNVEVDAAVATAIGRVTYAVPDAPAILDRLLHPNRKPEVPTLSMVALSIESKSIPHADVLLEAVLKSQQTSPFVEIRVAAAALFTPSHLSNRMSLLSKVIDARGRRGAELQAIASSLTDPECKLSQPEKLAILKQIEEAREAKGLVLSVTARVRNELLHPLIGNPFTQTPPTGQRRPASLRSSDF